MSRAENSRLTFSVEKVTLNLSNQERIRKSFVRNSLFECLAKTVNWTTGLRFMHFLRHSIAFRDTHRSVCRFTIEMFDQILVAFSDFRIKVR